MNINTYELVLDNNTKHGSLRLKESLTYKGEYLSEPSKIGEKYSVLDSYLILALLFSCHPILDNPISVGITFQSYKALLGGVLGARRLIKATRPLTCTHLTLSVTPGFPPFLSALHSLPAWLGLLSPNRSRQGRNGTGRSCLSTFSKQKPKSPQGQS